MSQPFYFSSKTLLLIQSQVIFPYMKWWTAILLVVGMIAIGALVRVFRGMTFYAARVKKK